MGTEAMCCLRLCRTTSSVALEKGLVVFETEGAEWREGCGVLQLLIELFFFFAKIGNPIRRIPLKKVI